MPAYDFLSGVASAVEKQSNALQAYGLQKREQEREQQERTQYNQVFTELGQFLASGQEIPEERIQTWTQMMGAAPTEIVTAFSNAMNTLGNRREEQQYRTAQTEIAQEHNAIIREGQLAEGKRFSQQLDETIRRNNLEAEIEKERMRSNERITGMQTSGSQMSEIIDRVKALQTQYMYAEDDNARRAITQEINEALGINVSNTPRPSKTPEEWIQSLGNIDDATARTRLLSIRNQFQEGTADRKSVNDAILMLTPDVSNVPRAATNVPEQSTTQAIGVTGRQEQQSDVSYPSGISSNEDRLNYAKTKRDEAYRENAMRMGSDRIIQWKYQNWKNEVNRLEALLKIERTRGTRVRF